MKKYRTIILVLSLILLLACAKKEVKIACVGDSITEGYGLAWQSKTAYPVDLYSPMKDQGANFPDNIHPNEQAVKLMAKIISTSISKNQ